MNIKGQGRVDPFAEILPAIDGIMKRERWTQVNTFKFKIYIFSKIDIDIMITNNLAYSMTAYRNKPNT